MSGLETSVDDLGQAGKPGDEVILDHLPSNV
jgi:hypothetical protein